MDPWLVTRFPNGVEVAAAPNDDPESIARAVTLGYTDTRQMSWDHEWLHSGLAHWFHLPHSPTLYAVAYGGEGMEDLAQAEEEAVLAMQRYYRALVREGLLPSTAEEPG